MQHFEVRIRSTKGLLWISGLSVEYDTRFFNSPPDAFDLSFNFSVAISP